MKLFQMSISDLEKELTFLHQYNTNDLIPISTARAIITLSSSDHDTITLNYRLEAIISDSYYTDLDSNFIDYRNTIKDRLRDKFFSLGLINPTPSFIISLSNHKLVIDLNTDINKLKDTELTNNLQTTINKTIEELKHSLDTFKPTYPDTLLELLTKTNDKYFYPLLVTTSSLISGYKQIRDILTREYSL